MAAQEKPKRKTPAMKPDEEARNITEKARGEAKTALTRARAAEQARLKAEEALAEAQEMLSMTQAEVERERRARAEAEKLLEEARNATQAEVEQAHQARVMSEQTLAEAERALKAARKGSESGAESMELLPTEVGKNGAEQRVTFIVRLTVDESDQVRRTEVEHARSGKKETFPALDVQRLVTFLKACIIPVPTLEPDVPPATGAASPPEHGSARLGLTISDVRVFRDGIRGGMALTLKPHEAFTIQARFRLEGSKAYTLADWESSFEMRVYVNEAIGGTSRLLTTYRGNLVEDVFEYTAQTPTPGLPPGLYRLVTLITLHGPIKTAAHHEGPMIQILEIQPSINAVTPLNVSLV